MKTMREIKFRAYWVNDKVMEHDVEDTLGEYLEYEVNGALHLMQFTGRQDKNDVYIFDGDIIGENHGDSPEPVGIVEYDDDLSAFISKNFNGGFEYLSSCVIFTTGYPFYVLGNIYENPELLKEKL